MGTQFSAEAGQSAAPPFMLARPNVADTSPALNFALSRATAAERLREKRSCCSRVAFLLCELGVQLAPGGRHKDQLLPVTRGQIAQALGTSLTRVKRTLGLLTLSGVIVEDEDGIRVVDWRRLSSAANYDAARLGLSAHEPQARHEEPAKLITAAGDPACFV